MPWFGPSIATRWRTSAVRVVLPHPLAGERSRRGCGRRCRRASAPVYASTACTKARRSGTFAAVECATPDRFVGSRRDRTGRPGSRGPRARSRGSRGRGSTAPARGSLPNGLQAGRDTACRCCRAGRSPASRSTRPAAPKPSTGTPSDASIGTGSPRGNEVPTLVAAFAAGTAPASARSSTIGSKRGTATSSESLNLRDDSGAGYPSPRRRCQAAFCLFIATTATGLKPGCSSP